MVVESSAEHSTGSIYTEFTHAHHIVIGVMRNLVATSSSTSIVAMMWRVLCVRLKSLMESQKSKRNVCDRGEKHPKLF